MATLNARLLALGRAGTKEPDGPAIFFSQVGTVAEGWRYGREDGSQACCMRIEGETDEHLSARAEVAARRANPKRRPLMLIQVIDDRLSAPEKKGAH